MPANLTIQYRKAEEAYRQASTPEEELRCLQAMLREIPKHKGTDHLQAELKQRISKARKEVESLRSRKKPHGLRIPRQGAGRVVMIGGPNSGKSQLLATLSRATPDVAAYPFTTREPQVGMMAFEDVPIQLIDTPPITADMLEPYHQGLIRGADLVFFVIDLGNDEGVEHGVAVHERLSQTKTRLARRSYLDDQDFGLSYTQTHLVLNKADLVGFDARQNLLPEFVPLDLETHSVSATNGKTLEPLREAAFQALDVVRVYTKQPNQKEPDYEKPFTVKRGGTLADVAALIHQDLAEGFKFGRVWGKDLHPGTQVKADYLVQDKDVVEIHR